MFVLIDMLAGEAECQLLMSILIRPKIILHEVLVVYGVMVC